MSKARTLLNEEIIYQIVDKDLIITVQKNNNLFIKRENPIVIDENFDTYRYI